MARARMLKSCFVSRCRAVADIFLSEKLFLLKSSGMLSTNLTLCSVSVLGVWGVKIISLDSIIAFNMVYLVGLAYVNWRLLIFSLINCGKCLGVRRHWRFVCYIYLNHKN